VRLQLQAAHILWDGRIDDEGIEEIDMIAYKETGSGPIKAGSILDLKPDPGQPQDISEEPSLGTIILSRVNEDPQQDQEATQREEMENAYDPQDKATNDEIHSAQERDHLVFVPLPVFHLSYVVWH
jgi:hypothetical protein